MKLFDLTEADISNLHALVSGSNLSLTANNARIVAELQAKLSNLQPIDVVLELEYRTAMTALDANVKRADQAEHDATNLRGELMVGVRRELELCKHVTLLERALCDCNQRNGHEGAHYATCAVARVQLEATEL